MKIIKIAEKMDDESDYNAIVKKEDIAVSVPADVSCPFCKEEGFDLIGLKSHLAHGDCEKYNEIDMVPRWLGFNEK